jgi:hypothetical protein
VAAYAGRRRALATSGGETWEITPPRLERGFREGCGNSTLGAMAAAVATGESWERSLAPRYGRRRRLLPAPRPGERKRPVIEELAERVEVRQL